MVLDHYIKYGKKYYDANKDTINAYRRAKYLEMRSEVIAKTRARTIRARYGMELSDYHAMALAQENKCAICKTESSKKLDIDHCHATGKVRGLLCNNCNQALGRFKDNITNLENAIEYLKSEYTGHGGSCGV